MYVALEIEMGGSVTLEGGDPIWDPATSSYVNELTLPMMSQEADIEAGYDANGSPRFNLYKLVSEAATDPNAAPEDEAGRVLIGAEQSYSYGYDGTVMAADAEEPLPGLSTVVGTTDVDFSEMVVQNQEPSPSSYATHAFEKVHVEKKGGLRTLSTSFSPAGLGQPRSSERRTYRKHGEKWILENMEQDVEVEQKNGRRVVARVRYRVKEVRYS